MDGFQVLEEMKHEKYKHIRTIILTNYEELENEILGLKAGAVDYIRKPLNIESLRVRIENQLILSRIQEATAQQLDKSNNLFKTIFDQAPIGIAISYVDEKEHHGKDYHNDDSKVSINPMFEKITGRTEEEYSRLGWVAISHPEDVAKDQEYYEELQAGRINSYALEKRYIKPDGTIVWAHNIVAPLEYRNNSIYSHICLVQDITERKLVEDALKESERSKSVLLSNLPGMAYRCSYDPSWTIQFVSDGCYDITGYRPENLCNNKDLSFNDLIAPEYRDILWEKWRKVLEKKAPFEYEYEIITAQGKRRWILEMGQGVFNQSGKVEALEGIIIDITQRKEQEIRLKYASEHDPLTGLYNRRYFEQFLNKETKLIHSTMKKAVLLLSLKKINNLTLIYGYKYSENIIVEFARRLMALTNQNCQIFQISVERFAFYVQDYNNSDELNLFCSSIFKVIENMQMLNNTGGSIGVYELDAFSYNAENILRNASIAAARANGQQMYECCFFDNALKAQVIRISEIKDELLIAAYDKMDKSIYLQFQPIMNAKTDQVEGFEALARMNSNKLGMVNPNEFIPIAEEIQLIIPIGVKVLYMAANFLKTLEGLGYSDIKVYVNISAIQLHREEFYDDILQLIQDTKINPKNLGLEITESIFSNDYEFINKKLDKLIDLGIDISIDDFGTGYSSLARERELNVNCLKIDKHFLDKLLYINHDEAITGDIISMAHKLGHYVIAEGVEEEIQKQYLLEYQCDFFQGYLFSKPLNPEDAIEFLKQNN
jgi:PAS domain S-box-containing protein/diguanylate cyclase (GGDEF)-like protein